MVALRDYPSLLGKDVFEEMTPGLARPPASVVTVTHKDAIGAQSMGKRIQGLATLVRREELQCAALNHHIEGSWTHGGITEVPDHKVYRSVGTAELRGEKVLQARGIEPASFCDVNRHRGGIQRGHM